MVAIARASRVLFFRQAPIDPNLLEEAYGAKEAAGFRQKIKRREYEKVVPDLLAAIARYPYLRRQLTRDPREDSNVIPNRLALIFLGVRFQNAPDDKRFRKYDKTKPAYIHSLDVTEIFLGIATRMYIRGAAIEPNDRVRDGVRRGFLHDLKEDTYATIAEIAELFGKTIAQSVENMSTPDFAELIRDERYQHIVQRYVSIPSGMELSDAEDFLEDLKASRRSTYDNLKASIKLEHKSYVTTKISLVECLLRGSDNIHFLISDADDLRKRNIFIRRRGQSASSEPTSAIGIDYRDLNDKITDHSVYQNALEDRIDQLRRESKSPREKIVCDAAKEVLRETFEKAKTKLQNEIAISRKYPHNDFQEASIATTSWKVVCRGATRFAYYARAMGRSAAL